jgi:aspergillopepsin I
MAAMKLIVSLLFISFALGTRDDRGILPSHLGIRAVEIPALPYSEQPEFDKTASGYMPLRRIPGPSSNHLVLQHLRSSFDVEGALNVTSNSTKITWLKSSQYVGSLSIGGKDFEVIVDSGSSDTWIIQKGYACVDYDGKAIPVSIFLHTRVDI